MEKPSNHLLHTKYRPDIDGLRAIAVLSVVAFHAFPKAMQGGFIGVDVFFVISGFLISTILFERLDAGTFSFSEFYVRRIKRIFPALCLVLFSCLVFGWLSLLPDELNQLGKHTAAGAGFVANFVFWGEAGYFNNAAETKPLLHLWSLAIEEQFYIAWPLLLWMARKSRRKLFLWAALVFMASFGLNAWMVGQDVVATFYSPLTRFWELAVGALLAWCLLYKVEFQVGAKRWRCLSPDICSVLGVHLLLAGFFLINKESSFPGYWALLPVFGTALLILGGPDAWINRKILSQKVLVWFGVISFPLYLWHWPLLSFGRVVNFDEPSLNYRITAVLLSVLLAWLTTKFIEKPIRFGAQTSSFKTAVLAGSLASLALVGAAFFSLNFSNSHSFEKLSVKRKGEHLIGSSLAWYRGKSDWLFLGNAHNKTVAKLKLAMVPSEDQLDATQEKFSKISEAGARYGLKTVLIVGPNKSSIYPEYLPDGLVPSPIKYSSFYLNKLRDIPSLTVYDPTHDLVAAKASQGLLYWRTDTHWNHKGAFLAYAGFSGLLDLPIPSVDFKQGSAHRGDLVDISKLKDFPLQPEDNWDIVWKEAPAWREVEVSNEQKTAFGSATVVTNAKPLSSKYVWVLGDSFANGLRPYFNATFREVHYIGHWADKIQDLSAMLTSADKKPDLIVIVKVERSF